MVNSKGGEWEKVNQSPRLKPTDDCYYLDKEWPDLGFKSSMTYYVL